MMSPRMRRTTTVEMKIKSIADVGLMKMLSFIL